MSTEFQKVNEILNKLDDVRKKLRKNETYQEYLELLKDLDKADAAAKQSVKDRYQSYRSMMQTAKALMQSAKAEDVEHGKTMMHDLERQWAEYTATLGQLSLVDKPSYSVRGSDIQSIIDTIGLAELIDKGAIEVKLNKLDEEERAPWEGLITTEVSLKLPSGAKK